MADLITDIGRGFSTIRQQWLPNRPFGEPKVGFEYSEAPNEFDQLPGEVQMGQFVQYSLQYLSSKEEIDKFLNVSASGSASFTGGSVSGAASTIDSWRSTSYDVIAVLGVRVLNYPWIISKAVFERQVLETLKRDGAAAFSSKFGDSFISEVFTGGMLLASFVYSLRSEIEAHAFNASVGASGVNWGVRGDMEARTSRSKRLRR